MKLRKSVRFLVVGIACCCFFFLGILTFYSPGTPSMQMDGNLAVDIQGLKLINDHAVTLRSKYRIIGVTESQYKQKSGFEQQLDEFNQNDLFHDFKVNENDVKFRQDNDVKIEAVKQFNNGAGNLILNNQVSEQNASVYPKMGKKRHTFKRSRYDPIPRWTNNLYYNHNESPSMFIQWAKEKESNCKENFNLFTHEFAQLRDAMVDRRYCMCSLRGGEFIENVLHQSEESEYYNFEMGCFRLNCPASEERPSYFFNNNNHLNNWLFSLSLHLHDSDLVDNKGEAMKPVVQPGFTIAVTRYEYANLYHTMTDWYNAFLMMQFFNHTPATTNILVVDAHPFGQLDSAWSQLFNSTRRVSALPPLSVFPELIWGTMGYNSPMTTYISSNPPLYEQFREFFLSGYDIEPSAHTLNCSNVSVLFIWRRDYVAHPRNPSGTVSRKIANEVQLLSVVRRHNPTFKVTGVQIDLLPVREQLHLVTNADVMVGMHGAGLTHAVFLPKRSALIELVPSYWSSTAEHFEAIAQWRGLDYERWVNNDPLRDIDEKSTKVPPNVVSALLRKVVRRLCGAAYVEDLMYGVGDLETETERSSNLHDSLQTVPGQLDVPKSNNMTDKYRKSYMQESNITDHRAIPSSNRSSYSGSLSQRVKYSSIKNKTNIHLPKDRSDTDSYNTRSHSDDGFKKDFDFDDKGRRKNNTISHDGAQVLFEQTRNKIETLDQVDKTVHKNYPNQSSDLKDNIRQRHGLSEIKQNIRNSSKTSYKNYRNYNETKVGLGMTKSYSNKSKEQRYKNKKNLVGEEQKFNKEIRKEVIKSNRLLYKTALAESKLTAEKTGLNQFNNKDANNNIIPVANKTLSRNWGNKNQLSFRNHETTSRYSTNRTRTKPIKDRVKLT